MVTVYFTELKLGVLLRYTELKLRQQYKSLN